MRTLRIEALAIVAFGLAAVLQLLPAIVGPSAIPGLSAGDNVASLWNLWSAREFLDGRAAFLHTSYLLHPYGTSLAANSHAFLPSLAAATVFGSMPLDRAYCFTLVAISALNGYCAYVLIRALTGAVVIAVVGGLLFQLSPFFSAHLLGHLNLMNGWVIPLGLICAHQMFAGGRWWWASGLGATVAAAGYTDYYMLAYLLVALAVMVGARWLDARVTTRPRGRLAGSQWILLGVAAACLAAVVAITLTGGFVFQLFGQRVSATSGVNLRTACWALLLVVLIRQVRPSVRVGWSVHVSDIPKDAVRLGFAAAVAAGLLLPLALRAAEIVSMGDYAEPAVRWRSAAPGLDVASLVLGNPFNPITGSVTRSLYESASIDLVEQAVWFGILPSFGLLWVLWRRGKMPADLRPWAVLGAVFAVWSLGPYLLVWGTNTGLWLPASLAQFVPGLANVRIPSRAIVVVYLCVPIVLALACRHYAVGRRVVAGLGALACLGYLAYPVPVTSLTHPVVYDELATLPMGGVLELPVGYRDGFGRRGNLDEQALFHMTIHGKPIVGGFVARMSPRVQNQYESNAVLRLLLDASEGQEMDEASSCEIDGWVELDVRYVVIDNQRASESMQRFVAECLPVRPLWSDERHVLYATF